MSDNSNRWDELEASSKERPGANSLRVAPQSGHDLFIGVKQPDSRRFFRYEVPSSVMPAGFRLPSLRSVRVSIEQQTDKPNTSYVELLLESADLVEVFKAMVNNLINAISNTSGSESGLETLKQCTERWRRLLETGGTGGLSSSEIRGLFGELTVLDQLLTISSDLSRTVFSWTGPEGKHQDFQTDRAALEVKTSTSKQPQSLVIASERELDPTGVDALYLMHVSLDERQGGTGRTLGQLVDVVQVHFSENSTALTAFEDRLLQAGYFNKQSFLYDSLRYTVRAQNAYIVRSGFPCITEALLPDGIGDVSYRIQLAALSQFSLPVSRALSMAAE